MNRAKKYAESLGSKAACRSALQVQPAMMQFASHRQPGVCECGSASFSLVSEINSEEVPGIRVSRMYECTVCGSYRLGK
ncbi:MAG: hypothetical protein KGZ73_02015 [Rhizobiales bacterium]|nr:hypothetical protein [Hyphomicrobiales bacterium]